MNTFYHGLSLSDSISTKIRAVDSAGHIFGPHEHAIDYVRLRIQKYSSQTGGGSYL